MEEQNPNQTPTPISTNQPPQNVSTTPSINQDLPINAQVNPVSLNKITRPILFKIIYWLALLEGSFFIFNVIFFTLIKIAPPFTTIIMFEHLLFGISAILIFFGLRKNKIWGLYSAIFMVLADLFTIVTNIDGASRDQGSFIMLSIEILSTLYLIYRFKNPNAANKWF